MAELNIKINGKSYGIACDDGQERRVQDLAKYIDTRVREIAAAGAASNESHLMVLASILMADEIFEMKDAVSAAANDRAAQNQSASEMNLRMRAEEEAEIAAMIDGIAARVEKLAG